MATWARFLAEAPDVAAGVRARFEAHKHKTMATVRADGGPRISGTEVEIRDDGLYLGGMPGNRRFADLRRDPRVAIHSGSDDPGSWAGDAKVGGLAVEVTDEAGLAAFRASVEQMPPGPFELFRVDLAEATLVRLAEDRSALVVDTWRPGRPVRSVRR
jgi:hypothetical protein